MSGLPSARGMTLPPSQGTVQIAERLGWLHFHPTIRVKGADGASTLVPFPYIGDLLLFLEDDIGPYCVNWNIKDKHASFRKPHRFGRSLASQTAAMERTIARQEIEATLYRQMGIRTQEVAGEELSIALQANMKRLVTSLKRTTELATAAREEIIGLLQIGLERQIPPREVFLQLASRYRLSLEDFHTELDHAIWHRKLRVDLFKAFPLDHPLVAERTDLLEKLKSWYRR